MKVQIYSIYDTKAESYHQPFFTTNDATAMRMLQNELQNPESNFSKYPEDYHLFHIGTFNDTTALLEHCIPESLGSAFTMKAQLNEMLEQAKGIIQDGNKAL